MRALLDVNALIAAVDVQHVHHRRVRDWLIRHLKHGWATCPITENGCVRIISQPTYANPCAASEVIETLTAAKATPHHAFWPDDISLTEAALFDPTALLSPKQLTDVYLLALAVKHQGRLVTLDRGINASAVKGASPKHLVVL